VDLQPGDESERVVVERVRVHGRRSPGRGIRVGATVEIEVAGRPRATVTARRVAVPLAVLLVAAAVGPGVVAADAIAQRTTVALDGDDVRATLVYDVPDEVSDLTVRLPGVGRGATVAETRGFDRVDEAEFEWTGRADPRIVLRVPADDRRVFGGDGWAMATRPDVRVSYAYRGTDPGFETSLAVAGEGYAADPLAYLGSHRRSAVTADGERTTLVVATPPDPDVTPAGAFLRLAPGRFDFGVRRDRTTAFVVPERTTGERRQLAGATAATSFWVGPDAVAMDRTTTAFSHEYVHTRLGVVGEGSAAWLTEGSAEYFGRVFALNAGAGEYDRFERSLAAPRYDPDRTPVRLTDRSDWRGTLANYEKGAHVLAALDAEIRDRTDGEHTLADVFAARAGDPFDSHADFRRAVASVTGADLGSWLDRYVAGTDHPPLPDDPATYVYGPTLDPDGDGVGSAAEADGGTHPFVADDPEATATPTPTPTATPTPTPVPTATPTDSPTPTTGFAPGFGVVTATAAVAGLALLARRRA
jgi:hypothetical protein